MIVNSLSGAAQCLKMADDCLVAIGGTRPRLCKNATPTHSRFHTVIDVRRRPF